MKLHVLYLVKSNYIETDIQKGFSIGISGTIEHPETLTYMICRCHWTRKNNSRR